MKKTNVMRLLEQAGIDYECKEYAYDENDLSGVHAAQALGYPPEMVFKTLVATGDKTGPCVFVIPVAEELDLKRAAVASGNKRVEMVPVRALQGLTGYIRGGCSPVGMKKKFPTFFDSMSDLVDRISVSAGARGCQVVVATQSLIEYTDATVCDLVVVA